MKKITYLATQHNIFLIKVTKITTYVMFANDPRVVGKLLTCRWRFIH